MILCFISCHRVLILISSLGLKPSSSLNSEVPTPFLFVGLKMTGSYKVSLGLSPRKLVLEATRVRIFYLRKYPSSNILDFHETLHNHLGVQHRRDTKYFKHNNYTILFYEMSIQYTHILIKHIGMFLDILNDKLQQINFYQSFLK